MEQWFLRITAYQDALLDDMAQLPTWPERVLPAAAQLGRQVARRRGGLPGRGRPSIKVFTTRVDTICGATFMVLAPEHPMVDGLLAGLPDAAERKQQIARLRAQDRRARLEGKVEKEGVFTGRYATNPFTNEKIPVWVGNFVLMGYGTGAIMSVPAHDQRDFEFARKYGLEVRVVIQPEGEKLDGATLAAAYDGPGSVVNSGEFDGLVAEEAIPRMAAWAAAEGHRQAHDHLPAQGLADQPPALLGHADPGRLLRQGRHAAGAGRRSADRAAAGRAVHRRGRQPAREGAGLRERDLPEVRRRGAARDRHDGHVRRLVLVLLPLPLAAQERRPLRPGRREVLVPDRPLRRRHRARDPAPRLLALLDQGDARPRPRDARRAGDAALPAGHGAQGRRGDVEVEGQHHRPRRRDRALRRRHAAALHPLRRPAGAGDGVERERHRGPAPLPAARLAARRRACRGARGRSRARRCPTSCRRRRASCAARCTRRSSRSRATSRSASSSTPPSRR